MKKCPTCDKDFPDSMRFCQTDGTVLIEKVDAAPSDPYKTVVGNQSDFDSAMPPLDPFKTMVASPPPKIEDDLLQLPEEPDNLKTMVVSQDELKAELKSDKAEDAPLDLPPAGQYAPSAPLIEPKPKITSGAAPTPPKAVEPFSTPPNFGEMSSPNTDDDASSAATAIIDKVDVPPNPPSPFDIKPFENDFSGKSPYGNQDSKPIPSPFDLSMPPGYLPPSMNPFGEAKSPPVRNYAEPSQPNPFEPATPFGNPDPFNQPLQQAEWSPPPAPDASWQNQGFGANTPFQPPAAGSGQGQNQTMALVSLILGIVGIVICQLTAPAALIVGFLARKKAAENPNEYGGSGLALAGMIMGGIGTLLFLLVIVYFVFIIGLAASGSRF